MEGFGDFIAFVLGVIVLIVFFILVNRVGTIQKGIANLQQQAEEQTRYLTIISANIATAMRVREPKQEGQ
ncbi:MAG: hypothetical protein ABSF71_31955 [Terriglobia bacterium]